MNDECANCGDPVAGFVNALGNKWLGNPVLYMGYDEEHRFANKYTFCNIECLAEKAAEWNGQLVVDVPA